LERETKPRFIEILAQYAVIGEALAILVAMVSIGIQWRQENTLAKAENLRAIAEHAATFNFSIISSEPLTEVWSSFGRLDDMTPTRRHQYQTLLIQWLIFHENLYFQHANGLLDDTLYASWDLDLVQNLPRHDLEALGMPIEEMFPTAYGKHLGEIVRRGGAVGASRPAAAHGDAESQP